MTARLTRVGRIREFALLIPVVAAKTGSQLTAHTASKSYVQPGDIGNGSYPRHG
jgi:hypothetical protein